MINVSPAHLNTTTATLAANRRGVLAMSLAMASFVANDALVKYVSESLPGAQLIFLRGLFATALLLTVAHAMGALPRWRDTLQRPVLRRSALDALATIVYLSALFHLPLGNATAINMATPLFMTLFAVLALRERVGTARWAALVVGFAGVLLVVQPRADGFNAWALLCVGGTLLHAARDLSTRFIAAQVPSILVTVSTAVAVTGLSGVLSLVQGWQPFTGTQLALLAGASVFLSGGYFLLVHSLRGGEMSVIAPFRYSGLLFALVLGWAVWGDVPNALAWLGISLLVGAGLYVLHTERVRAQATHRAALAAAPD